MLGDGRQDVDRQPVRGREIHRQELDAAVHQRGDKGYIPDQPIELGNHQRGPVGPAWSQRLRELGAVIASPAFYLNEFGDEPARADIADDGCTLGFKPDA